MKGLIFNLQKFCINDGPGIRTTVFLKGCPLRCAWCHNPESHSSEIQIMKENGKDILCGKYVEVEEVIEEVLKDEVFYNNSGGGLTLSGGEPLLQFDFAYALLRMAKQKGLHTCLETCGFTETEKILKIAEFTDIFLYDWKLTNDLLHKEYTGVSNQRILKNLKAIDSAGSNVILRCPIIPGVNDNEEHFLGIEQLANQLENVIAIDVEPYHPLGTDKYKRIGKAEQAQTFETPSENQVIDWIERIKKYTKVVVKKA